MIIYTERAREREREPDGERARNREREREHTLHQCVLDHKILVGVAGNPLPGFLCGHALVPNA